MSGSNVGSNVPEWISGISAAVDGSPDLVCVQEVFGGVLYVNPAGLGLIGAQHVSDVQLDPSVAVAAASGKGSWSGDVEVRHLGTGDWISFWVTAHVISGRHAASPVVVSVYRDLRERNAQERVLRVAIADGETRAREQQSIAGLSAMALSANLGEVLSASTQTAVSLLRMKCAVVFQPDRHGTQLNSVAYWGPSSPPGPVLLARSSHAESALRSEAAVVSEDRDLETRFPTDFMLDRDLRSGVAVKVPGRSTRPWGVLAVYGESPRRFSSADLAFVETIAGVLSAVIRRIELEGELRHRSLHDPLTGLANRVLAQHRIQQGLAVRYPFTAVLVVDLDNFKTINDTFGHAAGDRVLQTIGRGLVAVSGRHDTVARFGGDEFVVVHVSGRAEDIAEAILTEMRRPILLEGYQVTVEASIGIAVDDLPGTTVEGLIRRADEAMYAAKRRRRPGYVLHDRSSTNSAPVRRHVENDFEFEQ